MKSASHPPQASSWLCALVTLAAVPLSFLGAHLVLVVVWAALVLSCYLVYCLQYNSMGTPRRTCRHLLA